MARLSAAEVRSQKSGVRIGLGTPVTPTGFGNKFARKTNLFRIII